MFLKSETKTERKPAVKITLRYRRSSVFCEKGKIAGKEFQPLKREIFPFAIFEGKPIDVGANKPKLRRLEIRAFCDKMRSLISRRRNLGLFAPTSMGFPSKDSKWKDLSF